MMIPRSAVATWLTLAALRLLTLEGPARAIDVQGHPVAAAEQRHYRPAPQIDGEGIERVRPSQRAARPARADADAHRDGPTPFVARVLIVLSFREAFVGAADARAFSPALDLRQLPPARAPPARV